MLNERGLGVLDSIVRGQLVGDVDGVALSGDLDFEKVGGEAMRPDDLGATIVPLLDAQKTAVPLPPRPLLTA